MDEKPPIKDDKTNKVDSKLINQILGVMKNEFNKGQQQTANINNSPAAVVSTTIINPPVTPTEIEEEIVESETSKLKFSTVESTEEISDSTGKRSLRSHFKSNDDKNEAPPPEGTVAAEVKRSARRSKGPGESVLQSAIARKEKSFCSPPSNFNRKLRPTSNKKKTIPKPVVTLPPPKKSSIGRKRGRPPSNEKGETCSDISGASQEVYGGPPVLVKEELGDNEDRESFSGVSRGEDVDTPTPRLTPSESPRKRKAVDESCSAGSDETSTKGRKSRRSFNQHVRGISGLGGPSSPSMADSSSDSGLPPKPVPVPCTNPALKRVLCCCRSKRGPRAARCSADPLPSSEGEDGGPTSGELFCQAVDHIDQALVGCLRLAANTRLRRPASKIPYMLLCEAHARRLGMHNCCPGCGVFCSQGRFVQCEYNGKVHHFHRGCQLVVRGGAGGEETLCPHCGTPTPDVDMRLEMRMPRKPVFLPNQKQVKHGPSAKMGFSRTGEEATEEEDDLLPRATFVLPTLPSGPHSEEDREKYSLKNLFNAAKSGDTELVLNIFGFGHNVNHVFEEISGQTALHAAAQEGHLATVHLLVQAGAQLDTMDCEQLTPLMQSVLAGHAPVVKYLVKAGAVLTLKGSDGMTALHLAAKSGNLEACALLLTEHSSATPRALLDAQDDGGWTALVWACEHAHFPVVKYLMTKRADPLIRDAEQNIALHWSTFAGSVDISELLLNYGSDVNASNAQGDTPLHIGARQENYECVLLLLARGARVDARNMAGDRPLDCCPHPRTDCYTAINMNVQLQNLLSGTMERTLRILSNDVSRGKEQNPIQVLNGLDDEGVPTDFTYITENCFTTDIHVDRRINSLNACRCTDSCSTSNCLCAHISMRCWYDEEGRLLPDFNFSDPPLLFECNVGCACNKITCNNRVVQHGPTARFQLFRTEGKGWGVKTLRPIPKGTYVCEYIGEIITDSDADRREDDSYLFDLDNRDGETFCIDARRYGNVARFINHSCCPNLLPVKIFVDHQDLRFPRIAFFSSRDIAAGEELGFDYGEKFWIIKCKAFTCTCGAESCRYSSETIHQTLETYNRRLQMEDTTHRVA